MDAWDVSFGVSIDAARCSGDYGAGVPMFAAKHIEKCCLAPKTWLRDAFDCTWCTMYDDVVW